MGTFRMKYTQSIKRVGCSNTLKIDNYTLYVNETNHHLVMGGQ